MKILQVVGSLDTKDGGVVQVVLNLSRALAHNGLDVTIFAPLPDDPADVKNYPEIKIRYFKKPWFSKFLAGHALLSGYSAPLNAALLKEASGYDLIHTHSIWHYPHFSAARAARRCKKPLLTTIQGELTPWALKKQNAYARMVQKKILKQASAVQAVSKNEAKNIGNFIGSPNVFLLPNGINPAEFEGTASQDWIFSSYPELKGKKIILYLGRVNAGKGLETLAESFTEIVKTQPNARLLIVGPDAWNYGKKIKTILQHGGALNKAVFTGMLSGQKRLAALKCAAIFVLLSESEAFSLTIMEALYCGLPVIISPECGFPEIAESMAGKIIGRDTKELTNALLELLPNPEACKKIGENGQSLMRTGGYYWDAIAKKLISVYGKCISKKQPYGK